MHLLLEQPEYSAYPSIHKGVLPIDEPNGKTHFRVLDVDGGVRLEQFDEAHPQVKVFNEHGRLIAQHRPERISETA